MSSSEHKILTPEERAAKFVPPWEKDVCTDLLIELNACRRKNLYWRGTCEHELHAYEKCEYRGTSTRCRLNGLGPIEDNGRVARYSASG